MRVSIVRHGDETTTRGKVVAFTSTIHDNGRKIALFGDQATCGNCKGFWNIAGTGQGAGEDGRIAVINGDHVLCPCKKNRVIAGADAGMFIHLSTGAGNAEANSLRRAAPPTGAASHWISFMLKERGNCRGLRCIAHFEDGSTQWGTLSENNTVRFERYENGSACTHIELLPDHVRDSSGSVTESLLAAIGE